MYRLLSGSPARGRDRLLGGCDRLLRGRLENAVLLRLGAKLLDDVGDVLGLVDFGVAEVRRPVEIRAHHLDDVRKARERLYRRIPILVVDPGIIVVGDEGLVLVKPALRLDDLHRVGAGGQELREQRVGIERDRGEQLFEFSAGESFCSRRLLGGVRLVVAGAAGAAGLSCASTGAGAADSAAESARASRLCASLAPWPFALPILVSSIFPLPTFGCAAFRLFAA